MEMSEQEGWESLTDDLLLTVFEQLIEESAQPPCNLYSANTCKSFIWLRKTLPLVCKRWNRVLAQPSQLWRTVHICVDKEVSYERPGIARKSTEQHPNGSVSAPLGSSPSSYGGYMDRGLATTFAKKSLSLAVLHSESVLAWISHRKTKCEVLFLNLSNINHNFNQRSFDRLVALLKSNLKVLHLVDSPSVGHQDSYESLSTLKCLEVIHVQVLSSTCNSQSRAAI